MVDIYMPVVECRYVPFFADVLSIYSFIIFFSLKEEMPNVNDILNNTVTGFNWLRIATSIRLV
jgi:hypothetical protein